MALLTLIAATIAIVRVIETKTVHQITVNIIARDRQTKMWTRREWRAWKTIINKLHRKHYKVAQNSKINKRNKGNRMTILLQMSFCTRRKAVALAVIRNGINVIDVGLSWGLTVVGAIIIRITALSRWECAAVLLRITIAFQCLQRRVSSADGRHFVRIVLIVLVARQTG